VQSSSEDRPAEIFTAGRREASQRIEPRLFSNGPQANAPAAPLGCRHRSQVRVACPPRVASSNSHARNISLSISSRRRAFGLECPLKRARLCKRATLSSPAGDHSSVRGRKPGAHGRAKASTAKAASFIPFRQSRTFRLDRRCVRFIGLDEPSLQRPIDGPPLHRKAFGLA
jgi:hypothetical protein